MRRVLQVFVLCLVATLAFGEKRFNRAVLKVADPKAYKTYKLDDNTFHYLERSGLAVSSMVYSGTRYYYVEVAITNNRTENIEVSPANFVQFEKPGYTILPVDTAIPINELRATLGREFVPTPPPSPTRATTTTNGTVSTYGNRATVNATSTTQVDNSAAAWHNLGQAMAARSFYNLQSINGRFVEYLSAFAHEAHGGSVAPGEAKVFVFIFQQLKPKKAPFTVRAAIGAEVFEFKYKE